MVEVVRRYCTERWGMAFKAVSEGGRSMVMVDEEAVKQ